MIPIVSTFNNDQEITQFNIPINIKTEDSKAVDDKKNIDEIKRTNDQEIY